ncbi:MAG: hypothetical protein KDA32_00150 [Phycisphaerales bacterium]|nr:hypothetical protein [Phycisphaerales bacterium]
MRAAACRYQRRAVTLLEALIAITLMVLMLTVLLTFFWQAIDVRQQLSEQADKTALARQVLANFETELIGCVGMDALHFPAVLATTDEESAAAEDPNSQGGTGDVRMIGTRRTITFLTTALPADHQYTFLRESDEPPQAQHDVRLVHYEVWVDPDDRDENGEPLVGGIIRTEKKTLGQTIINDDDPLQIRVDLWSNEFKYLEFRYFDGVEWTTDWNSAVDQTNTGNTLPQLVQVTLGYNPLTTDDLEDRDLDEYPIDQPEYALGDAQEHSDRYSIVVRIPAADRFFRNRMQRVSQQVIEQLGLTGEEAAP